MRAQRRERLEGEEMLAWSREAGREHSRGRETLIRGREAKEKITSSYPSVRGSVGELGNRREPDIKPLVCHQENCVLR